MLTSVDVKFISIVHLYREVYEIKAGGGYCHIWAI